MAETKNTLEQRNEAQAKTIQKQAQEIKRLRQELIEADIWSRFAGYLLENCEKQEITEESLQYWMSEMLHKEKEAGVVVLPPTGIVD